MNLCLGFGHMLDAMLVKYLDNMYVGKKNMWFT